MNFSKSGISTSIGGRGASVTIGPKSTYFNTSIPVLGISNQQKLSGSNGNESSGNQTIIQKQNEDNIFSADLQEITSKDMQGVKEAILAAHKQRAEFKNDLLKVKAALAGSKFKLMLSYILLYGLIKKTIPKAIKADIKAQKEALLQLQKQIEECFVGLNFVRVKRTHHRVFVK